MSQALQIRPGPLYQGSTPARDPAYRRFIKRLPCVGCGTTWWIDPAHTGSHGLGQKSDDYSCIPLCRKCHQEYDACPWKFVFKHGLDIPALIQMFRSFYQSKLGGKAA
jgi:hypothetical protein